MEPLGSPKMSVRKYIIAQKSAVIIYFVAEA
jgi:hypothetical protein